MSGFPSHFKVRLVYLKDFKVTSIFAATPVTSVVKTWWSLERSLQPKDLLMTWPSWLLSHHLTLLPVGWLQLPWGAVLSTPCLPVVMQVDLTRCLLFVNSILPNWVDKHSHVFQRI